MTIARSDGVRLPPHPPRRPRSAGTPADVGAVEAGGGQHLLRAAGPRGEAEVGLLGAGWFHPQPASGRLRGRAARRRRATRLHAPGGCPRAGTAARSSGTRRWPRPRLGAAGPAPATQSPASARSTVDRVRPGQIERGPQPVEPGDLVGPDERQQRQPAVLAWWRRSGRCRIPGDRRPSPGRTGPGPAEVQTSSNAERAGRIPELDPVGERSGSGPSAGGARPSCPTSRRRSGRPVRPGDQREAGRQHRGPADLVGLHAAAASRARPRAGARRARRRNAGRRVARRSRPPADG